MLRCELIDQLAAFRERDRRYGDEATVIDDRSPFQARHGFLQQLKPLAADRIEQIGDAGGVAFRLRDILDDAVECDIATAREGNRDASRLLLQRAYGCPAVGDDDVWFKGHQPRRHGAYPVGGGTRMTNVDPQIASFDPAELRQSFPDRGDERLARRFALDKSVEYTQPPRAPILLRERAAR